MAEQTAHLEPVGIIADTPVYVLDVNGKQVSRFADLREFALRSADEWLAEGGFSRTGDWKFAAHTEANGTRLPAFTAKVGQA